LLGAKKNPLNALTGCGVKNASQARRLALVGVRRLGDDLCLECRMEAGRVPVSG
jgi:hypothetical protein